MKVAILTSQERVEKFTDWSLVPKDTELIYIGQTYTDDEVIQKAKEADAILVDAVNAVSGHAWASAPLVTWFLSHFTGAAFTRFVVKVPALLQGCLL